MKLRRSIALVTLLPALTLPLMASAREQVRSQEEFGFSVALPKGPICDSAAGGHHHGWGAPLDGNCGTSSRGITVLASYNAAFHTSPEEAAYCTPAEGGSLAEGAKLGLRFRSHRSATCLTKDSDGLIVVSVVTQAGRWPEPLPNDPPEFRTAWINYSAYLRTSPAKLNEDLRSFRRVLASVRIAPRRPPQILKRASAPPMSPCHRPDKPRDGVSP